MTPPAPDTCYPLVGAVGVDDAEPLREALAAAPDLRLDLEALTHLHTAGLQVLMAAARPVARWPADDALARWLRAALAPSGSATLRLQEDAP